MDEFSYRDATMVATAIAKIVTQRERSRQQQYDQCDNERKARFYIDALQNGRGKTLAGVYSLRDGPNALVSDAPLK